MFKGGNGRATVAARPRILGDNEAGYWLGRAAEAGDSRALRALAGLLIEHGHVDEALHWCRQAADAGDHWDKMRLGDLLIEHGHVDEALHRYRQAADAGERWAMVPLAELLLEHGRVDEALYRYRQAADAGDIRAMRRLVGLLNEHGRVDDAEQWSYRVARTIEDRSGDTPAYTPEGAVGDWDLILTTAIVTAVVVPFVQTLVTKAAEDTYVAVRAVVRRLISKHRSKESLESQLIIFQDPDTGIALHLWADVSDEAIRALVALDLKNLTVGLTRDDRVHLVWNSVTASWRWLVERGNESL